MGILAPAHACPQRSIRRVPASTDPREAACTPRRRAPTAVAVFRGTGGVPRPSLPWPRPARWRAHQLRRALSAAQQPWQRYRSGLSGTATPAAVVADTVYLCFDDKPCSSSSSLHPSLFAGPRPDNATIDAGRQFAARRRRSYPAASSARSSAKKKKTPPRSRGRERGGGQCVNANSDVALLKAMQKNAKKKKKSGRRSWSQSRCMQGQNP